MERERGGGKIEPGFGLGFRGKIEPLVVLAEAMDEYNGGLASVCCRCVCAEHPQTCCRAAKVSAQIGCITAIELWR